MSQLRHNQIMRYLLLVLSLLGAVTWAQRSDVAASQAADNGQTGQATVVPIATVTDVCPSAHVDIIINDVVDLYGYQFELLYDDSLVDATAQFVHGFFDANASGVTLPGWDAACAAGTCRFTRSEIAPDGPVSGSGTVATVTLTADAPATAGSFTVQLQNVRLTDRDSFAIPATAGSLPLTVCGDETGTCPVDPAAGTVGNRLTTILAAGMGNSIRSRTVAKLTVPDPARVVDLYGQMAAKAYPGIRYVRFIYGDRQYIEVQPATDLAASGAINWWGSDLDETKLVTTKPSVKGRWFFLKGAKREHLTRAFVLYPTHATAESYANAWSTYTYPGNFVANTPAFSPVSSNYLAIPETQATTDIVVQLAVSDVERHGRTIDVTVRAGPVTQSLTLPLPTSSRSDLLDLIEVTLPGVPAGVDTVEIVLESPAINGDSAALLGAAAHYRCEP